MHRPADIEEARRRLAEHPRKGDPTAMPGETLEEKAERLGAVQPTPTTTTEYAVRFEHGEIVARPSREFAQNTVRAVQSRGGTAALMTRQVITTAWTEAAGEPDEPAGWCERRHHQPPHGRSPSWAGPLQDRSSTPSRKHSSTSAPQTR